MTDLALDFGHEAMTPDPIGDHYASVGFDLSTPRGRWLARRGETWGASELAPLLLSMGLAPANHGAPAWVVLQAEHYSALGIPKLIAWKAGLRARPNQDNSATKGGRDLERAVFEEWKRTDGPAYARKRGLHHASAAPQQWFPLVDRYCPSIAVTPDAWGFCCDDAESHVSVEVKCTRKRMPEPPWAYVQQNRSQSDAMGATHGFLVVGELWLWPEAPPGAQQILTFRIERDELDTRRRYAAATEALWLVAQLRELAAEVTTEGMDAKELRQTRKARKAAAARCAELYRESVELLAPFRPKGATRLGDALAEIDGLDGLTDY